MHNRDGQEAEKVSGRKGTGIFSRRNFLKGTLICTIGGASVAGGLLDSLSTGPKVQAFAGLSSGKKKLPRQAIGHIARVSLKESVCASCGTCDLVCAAAHGDMVGPSRTGIWLERHPFECVYDSITCQQCEEPECYYACEVEGAFYIDPKTGARAIDGQKCQGCRKCLEACVEDPPRIRWDAKREKSFKCDLCMGQPEGPACVRFCPQKALTLDKDEET